MDSLIGLISGGQGWPPRAGTGASPRGICRSTWLTWSSPSPSPVAGRGSGGCWPAVSLTAGRAMLPVSRVADGGGAELSEGGQGGVSADPVPGCGPGFGPSRTRPSRLERLLHRPTAPGDGDEVGHGGRAVRRGPAQVERVAVRAGDQPPDQQVLPLRPRWRSSPSRCSGAPWSRSRRTGARTPRPVDGLIGADRRARGQPDLVVARDDPHIGQAVLGAALLRSGSLRP